MIHFVTWIPLPYHQTLCNTLQEHYGSNFVVWYGETRHHDFPFKEGLSGGFKQFYLDQVGYGKLAGELFRDKNAVVILGGWRSPMSARVFAITALLRTPVLLWADHPHPRKRTVVQNSARNVYLRIVNQLVRGFLACGQPTVEHLASLGLSAEKITNFPCWTDLPPDWSLPPGYRVSDPRLKPLRLIGVGRLAKIKRFDVAIRAMSLANQRAGYCQAELLLAGDGPERNDLEELARSIGCQEQVRFAGWLESDEIPPAIKGADALVIPSVFEGYGAVVLEAMAAGRPVLASDCVTAALDRDEGTGAVFFHSLGDAATLSLQIASLAENRDLLYRASVAARATAEKWPTSRAVEILNDLISQTKAGKGLLKSQPVLSAFD